MPIALATLRYRRSLDGNKYPSILHNHSKNGAKYLLQHTLRFIPIGCRADRILAQLHTKQPKTLADEIACLWTIMNEHSS